MALVRPRFSKTELTDINERLEAVTTKDVLNWVELTFGRSAAQISSFGLEDQALFDIFGTLT